MRLLPAWIALAGNDPGAFHRTVVCHPRFYPLDDRRPSSPVTDRDNSIAHFLASESHDRRAVTTHAAFIRRTVDGHRAKTVKGSPILCCHQGKNISTSEH